MTGTFKTPRGSAPRIAPIGKQSDVIYYSPERDLVVLGTAGTGKTTMAVLRAKFLADEVGTHGGPVLLVTYNKALVRFLRHLVPHSLGNVTVETYGQFARGYLSSIGAMPRRGGIAEKEQLRGMVAQAVIDVSRTYKPGKFFSRDTGFFLDELAWISEMGISTEDAYLTADRVGRKTGLGADARKAVWRIRTSYLRIRSTAGYLYDWTDLATSVRRGLANDTRARLYRHVVIDEGQDLSPECIRSLKEAVEVGGTVSFFGDYHQQIYGQGLSFRQCGLDVLTIDRFQDNYRNTAQIARIAIAMSSMSHMKTNASDLVEPKEPTVGGSLPALVACRDTITEVQAVQSVAIDQGDTSTVAILARTWPQARTAANGLSARPLKENRTEPWDPSPGIHYGTYHSAKGLEFDVVLLPFCSSGDLPLQAAVEAYGSDDARTRDGKLLYVAVTRARAELVVTYCGELSTLIPADPHLWQKSTR